MITEKGSGRIEINVLKGEATYNEIKESDLHIETELNIWLKEELEDYEQWPIGWWMSAYSVVIKQHINIMRSEIAWIEIWITF